jgi:hypothetical protein
MAKNHIPSRKCQLHAKSETRGGLQVTCSCDDKHCIDCLAKMFVDMTQIRRIEAGQCPARRPVFLRLHGVIHGRFEINPKLPKKLRLGLFGQKDSYDTWVRYSSDAADSIPDYKSTCGIGIKLFGVDSGDSVPDEGSRNTADLLMQNMNVFFVNDAKEMCEFTKASFNGKGDEWLKEHPVTAQILDKMAKVYPSVFTETLWSVIPFQMGEGQYCKYKLVAESVPDGPTPNYNDWDYLQKDLEARMKKGEARLAFWIQMSPKPGDPLSELLTVPWNETETKMYLAATLILPQQDITLRSQSAYGEALSFNPARVPAENRPIGSIAQARRAIYKISADQRRNANGQSIGEPDSARAKNLRGGKPYLPSQDTKIVSAAIHPAIGIARVGNSREIDGYYIGPEVFVSPVLKPGQLRDGNDAIKRQAARFRIYGLNAHGAAVAELTPDNAVITWSAHLVNKKSSWYRFDAAMDIPLTANISVPRRNPSISFADRSKLVIDPGRREIAGKNTLGRTYQFDTGVFKGVKVPLGEIRTDENGRLLVLGGYGNSGTPSGAPIFTPSDPNSFNNADDWYDDMSDGPITAKVVFQGIELSVKPSWVVVAPPDYAPHTVAWRTMGDLMEQVAIEAGLTTFPAQVLFSKHIYPILGRLTGLQWVNAGFAAMFGANGALDMTNPVLIKKLSQSPCPRTGADPYQELRRTIMDAFRPFQNESLNRSAWPWIFGDAFGYDDTAPAIYLALSDIRMTYLKHWTAGNFVDDSDLLARQSAIAIEAFPIGEQPEILDRASMHFCLADAFHPGCEMTWPMRHATMYTGVFRLRHQPPGWQEPNYGDKLTQPIVLQPSGPLYGSAPGDITRWMAMPWQADTGFCRSGYDPAYDPYLPTFWPARVPNQVLTEEDYQIVMDKSRSQVERIMAFNNRESWLRVLPNDALKAMDWMVKHFWQLGIVEQRPGPDDLEGCPSQVYVESLPKQAADAIIKTLRSKLKAMEATPVRRAKTVIEQAGWVDDDHRRAFLAVKTRRRL